MQIHTVLGDKIMKKFKYRASVRLTEPVKQSLQEICDTYSLNESDYIRQSVQRCIMDDMQQEGLEPKFRFVGV